MIAAPLFFLPFAVTLIWLLVLRPYCIRNGKGYTAGANTGVTLWIDWQQAKEIAVRKGDRWMIVLCRIFLLLQLLIVAAIIVLILLGGED